MCVHLCVCVLTFVEDPSDTFLLLCKCVRCTWSRVCVCVYNLCTYSLSRKVLSKTSFIYYSAFANARKSCFILCETYLWSVRNIVHTRAHTPPSQDKKRYTAMHACTHTYIHKASTLPACASPKRRLNDYCFKTNISVYVYIYIYIYTYIHASKQI
jgi:hypothetical protein